MCRPVERREFHARKLAVLGIVLATFAAFIYGVMRLGWDFNQMSGLFFAMGIVVGLVGGLGVAVGALIGGQFSAAGP